MSNWFTTSTASGWVDIEESNPNTPVYGGIGNEPVMPIVGGATSRVRALLKFLVPDKPRGVDRIVGVTLTLTTRYADPAPVGTRTWAIYEVGKPWRSYDVSSGTATWNSYQHPSLAWATAGGDLGTHVGSMSVAGGYSASFTAELPDLNIDWGDRFGLLVRDVTETGSNLGYRTFATYLTNATTAWMPHVRITFADDPPAAINDLSVSPDLSLSEASYTFRQRAVLKWSPSDENDFYRYRIRYGINRSQKADHIHKAFVNSRASTTYLDPTLYTDGSTIYYSIYPEDFRNGSTSTALGATYTNVSNIVSWTKPAALIGRVSPSSSASVLNSVELNVRQTNDSAGIGTAMGSFKRAKIIWADKSYSFTQNLTSAGGYAYARHRYTLATSGYTLRALVEDVKGFRSGLDSYGTSVTIANPGPVAKLLASPTRQRTASTFSLGLALTSSIGTFTQSDGTARIYFSKLSTMPTNGIVTRYGFVSPNAAAANGTYTAILLRDEDANYRIVYADVITTATLAGTIRRNVNWRVYRGDLLGLGVTGSTQITFPAKSFVNYAITLNTQSSVVVAGIAYPKSRVTFRSTNHPIFRATVGYTNPVHFSAKDSFARGSNRIINRFRWNPDYADDFSSGATYTTGATTSFFWAWTTATTQFMAVRAVDDSHASSIDVVGVVVETEATFRIPDDLRDGIESISDNHSRAMAHDSVMGMDYGSLEMGSLEPLTLIVKGTAHTLGTSNTWIDIDRLQAAFRQRKRIYVLPGFSTSTYAQGYIVEVPVSRNIGDQIGKMWSVRIEIPNEGWSG